VVLVTSRQGHFTAASSDSDLIAIILPRHPFSRSYGVILPSSLTRVLPFALVFSTRLPVSVCGTDTQDSSLRGFSWQLGSAHLRLYGPGTALRIKKRIFLLLSSPYQTCTRIQLQGWPTMLRPPVAPLRWGRNINRLSIAYASRPRLRPA
jgi:hypothetical protein